MRWALEEASRIQDYRAAHDAVSRRHAGMHPVHTINNACLTIFGLSIGGDDFTKVIGETVAMGFDNDCTAAGSIAGVLLGANGIPPPWTRRFNDKMVSRVNEHRIFALGRCHVPLCSSRRNASSLLNGECV